MDEKPKKKSRLGRERRYRKRLREARLAAEAASQTPGASQGANQATGMVAGPDPAIPRLNAYGGPGTQGHGEMAEGAAEQAQRPQEASQGYQTPMFERIRETRTDAYMTRRALRLGWLDKAPKPEHIEAVLTKATVQALSNEAKPHEVQAVAKLQLEYSTRVLNHEHHEDRMDYYRQALALRERDAGMDGGGAGMSMETEGPAKVTVYLPNNRRADILDDDLRPEDLLKDDDE